MEGYIKLYRSLRDKGYWYDSEYVHLWVHLLMKANWKETEYLFNGKIERLLPGQFITGRNSLVKETHIHRSKVERILKCFENEHQIEQLTNNKFRIITILNWEEYQITEHLSEQPVSNKRAASEQPVSTAKEVKKDKNIYTIEFESFWMAYPNKKSKKAAAIVWGKLNGDRPTIEVLLAKIDELKLSSDWQKDSGAYIPHPATWLNREGWHDDPKVSVTKQTDRWKQKIPNL